MRENLKEKCRKYWIVLTIVGVIIALSSIGFLYEKLMFRGITIYVSEVDYHIEQPGNRNATITVTLVFKKVPNEKLTIKHIQLQSLFTDDNSYQSVFQDFREGDKLTISYHCSHLVSMAYGWRVIICLGYMDFLEFEVIPNKEYTF